METCARSHAEKDPGSWAEPSQSDLEHPTGERSTDHKKTKNNPRNLRKSITKTSRLLRIAKNGRRKFEKDYPKPNWPTKLKLQKLR